MRSASEQDIRNSFINCSKGEAKRLPVPRNLATQPWEDLDFLGWHDPQAPERSYLVAELAGDLTGIALRIATQKRGLMHTNICSLCLTAHSGNGVSMMTARKTGEQGRLGNSAGLYVCTDLACSLYLRGKKTPVNGSRIEESLSEAEQVARLHTKLSGFFTALSAPVSR
ncbi:FBP domain-containing protein [Catelliglobosispora koreensis]|uniref:FBP domain-containing protein n=1 Tax=Catelliglobosispora koreensis TaxID=129052 RepID=UPI0003737E40|nr:FBP domain-containing protein [Catelliglobosispora koreensis]